MRNFLGVILLVLIPAFSKGSVVYTFSQAAGNGGNYGFTLTEPDYLQLAPGTYFSFTANMFSSCDMSGNPLYVCQGGNFTVFGDGYVGINFGFMDPHGSGFGASNYVQDTFAPFSFAQSGIYFAFDGGSTGAGGSLSISDPSDASLAPEPGTIGTLVFGLGILTAMWKRK